MSTHRNDNSVANNLPELMLGYSDIQYLFKGGSVLRGSDFSALINYAHYLHKLLGVESDNADYTPALGDGLTVNESGVLTLNHYASTWVEDISNMLRATAIALSDECVVFIAYSKPPAAPSIMATGFARGVYMFPVLISKLEDYKYGQSIPYSGGASEWITTCSAFRVVHWPIVSHDEITYQVPLKKAGSQNSFIHKMDIIKIEEVDVMSVMRTLRYV